MSLLSELIVPLSMNLDEFKKGADEAKTQAGNLADGLATVGSTAITGGLALVAAGVGAITAATIGGIGAANDWADTVDSIGDALGTTAEEGSGLAVMMQGIGGSSEELTKQLVFMAKGLENVDGSLGPTGKALEALGIQTKNADGSMRSATEIFGDVSNKLAAMPDGIEKSTLAMDIFGKSGSAMSDTFNAAANGGMQAAMEKAKALGLSMSEDGVSGSIQFGKAMEDLKMIGQGLMVSIGNELIPILTPLIQRFSELAQQYMPAVREALSQVGDKVGEFVKKVVDFIPKAYDWFKKVADFLKEHKSILIGIFVAIGVAIGAFVYTTVIPAAIAMIAALAPIVLPILAIAAVVALLAEAWNKDWGGIKTTLTNVWNNNLKPIFDVLVNWLKVNIPAAITTLTNFWNNTLKPALMNVWRFIQDNVIPIFKSLADFWKNVLNVGITTLSNLWKNTLQPALKKVIDFITDKVIPGLKTLRDYIVNTLGPKLEWLKKNILDPVKDAFQRIADKINWLITKAKEFIELLKKIKVPPLFTPGSPTPFELGLRGIGEAMDDLNKKKLPAFSANLSENKLGGRITGSTGNSNVTNNYILNSTSSRIDRIEEAFAIFKARAGAGI